MRSQERIDAMRVLWEEVLETNVVGLEWDFFEMGGSSLLAVRLVDLIEEQYGVALDITDLYDHPTVHELVEFVESLSSGDISDSAAATDR
jgi:acyl carrier protein